MHRLGRRGSWLCTAVILLVAAIMAGCGGGGITTTQSISASLGGLGLSDSSGTGSVDGYVYVPAGAATSLQQVSDVIFNDSPPGTGYVVLVHCTITVVGTEPPLVTESGPTGYFAIDGCAPGNWTLSASGTDALGNPHTGTYNLVVTAGLITHTTEGGYTTGGSKTLKGFGRAHVDLTSNSAYMQVRDRIVGVSSGGVGLTADNAGAEEVTIRVYMSTSGLLTASALTDAISDDPPAYLIWQGDFPPGNTTISGSQGAFTNLAGILSLIQVGDFYVYYVAQTVSGEPTSISVNLTNLSVSLSLKIRVL